MYSGEVVEEGTIDSIFSWPKHPYTKGLFGCIPAAARRQERAAAGLDQGPACRCRTSGPRAATSARAAASSRKGECDKGLIPMEGRAHRRRPGAPGPLRALERDRCQRKPCAPKDSAASRSRSARPSSTGRRDAQVLQGARPLAGGPGLRRRGARGQGEREHQLPRGRGRDGRHRGRVRLRQVHLRQGADGAGDGDRRRGRAGRDRPRFNIPVNKRPARAAFLGADGVPEPQRHPQPLPLGRLSDWRA